MKAQRILVVSDSFHTMPEAVSLLEGSGHFITHVPHLTPWTKLEEDDRCALSQAEAVIMGRVLDTGPSAFSLAPNLKVIALHTSGSDTVDVEEATRRGVLVTNVKGVNAEQCAEFAMGLMLCAVRQILTGDRALRSGLWAAHTQTSMDIYGSTVGVVGFGQIAKAFVVRAKAFGARVLVHSRTEDEAAAKEFGVEYASLEEVMRTADTVCLFASLTRETRRMIGARELGWMKPTAFLVNIARGELTDEAALLDVLRERRIAGAALDVYEVEPLLESPFFALDNVVLTPHQAGLTRNGKLGAAVRAAQNALEVLKGRKPRDAINVVALAARHPSR